MAPFLGGGGTPYGPRAAFMLSQRFRVVIAKILGLLSLFYRIAAQIVVS